MYIYCMSYCLFQYFIIYLYTYDKIVQAVQYYSESTIYIYIIYIVISLSILMKFIYFYCLVAFFKKSKANKISRYIMYRENTE